MAHVLGLLGVLLRGGQHVFLRVCEHTVEAAQHRERQDHLAVLVALVGAARQVADAPDEVRQFTVRLSVHAVPFVPARRQSSIVADTGPDERCGDPPHRLGIADCTFSAHLRITRAVLST